VNSLKKTQLRAAIFVITLAWLAGAQAQEARLDVQADQVVGRVSRLLTGACIEDVNHEIYGGIYSQMVFGESFHEPAPSPSVQGFIPTQPDKSSNERESV
jgi:hypothetical protein